MQPIHISIHPNKLPVSESYEAMHATHLMCGNISDPEVVEGVNSETVRHVEYVLSPSTHQFTIVGELEKSGCGYRTIIDMAISIRGCEGTAGEME